MELLADALAGAGAALVSHEFRRKEGIEEGKPSCELVLDGLTFDLFVVNDGAAIPDYIQPLAPDLAGGESLVLLPGPHLASAARTLPVVRGQWRMAQRLCTLVSQVAAIGWSPSRTAMTPDVFTAMSGAWVDAGVFPPLGLIAFLPAMGKALHSCGLDHFTTQELRIEPDLAADHDRAIRLGLRLAETLVLRGPLAEAEQFADPGGGAIRLEPSANGKFVRVWPA